MPSISHSFTYLSSLQLTVVSHAVRIRMAVQSLSVLLELSVLTSLLQVWELSVDPVKLDSLEMDSSALVIIYTCR